MPTDFKDGSAPSDDAAVLSIVDNEDYSMVSFFPPMLRDALRPNDCLH